MPTAYELELAENAKYEKERKSLEMRGAHDVARLLGEGWTATERKDGMGEYYRMLITGPNCEELHFIRKGKHSYENRNRIVIYGTFPNGKGGRHYAPSGPNRANVVRSITVADTKADFEIVKEIKRRLLPTYTPAVIEAWGRKAHDEGEEVRLDHFYKEFIRNLGCGEVNKDGRELEVRTWGRRDDSVFKYLEAKSCASSEYDKVTVKVDLTRDAALELAKFLKKLDAPKRKPTAADTEAVASLFTMEASA